jgi:hypothetical protein
MNMGTKPLMIDDLDDELKDELLTAGDVLH